jgi:hypothetical protein
MNKQISYGVWFAYIILMFAYLLFVNLKTPIIGEDYAFILYANNKSDLLKLIFNKIIDWFNYNSLARFNQRIGDTIATLWLNLGGIFGIGKTLFSILNAIVAFLFFTLIFFWSNCRLPNLKSIKDLAVFSTIPILFLICNFSIGEIFFWCDGSANYLWAGSILLGVAIPYRKYLHDTHYKMKNILIFGYIIVSYIAAFTNENSVPIIILLGGFLILRDLVKKGIKKIPIWLLLSVLSMGIGYSILLFSPNTKRRSLVYRDMFNLPDNMTLGEIKNNIVRVIHTFFDSNYRFIIVFIIIFFLFCLYQIKLKKLTRTTLNYMNIYTPRSFIILSSTIGLLFIISFITHNILRISFAFFILLILLLLIFLMLFRLSNHFKLYENLFLLFLSSISIIALFFAPYTEPRTFFFVQIFLLVIIIRINYILLSSFSTMQNKWIKYIPNICLCFLSIIFLNSLLKWTLDYSQFDRLRSESIRRQVQEGKKTVIAKMYPIERNKYLNTREEWIRYIPHSGDNYTRFHGAKEIVWSLFSYEEEQFGSRYVANISIPHDVSGINTHEISSINIQKDNLVLVCGINDPQVYLPLEDPIIKPSGLPCIEIEYTNSEPGTLQIYFDFGNGLSEADSVRNDIENISEMSKIRLPINCWHAGKYLYSIRVDPPDGTIFEIKSINIGEM